MLNSEEIHTILVKLIDSDDEHTKDRTGGYLRYLVYA